MSKDIHKQPFDESTKAKLAIFRDYLRNWLPVFLCARTIYYPTITIYDFFSGPGTDGNGTDGTPCIILEELEPYREVIQYNNLKVNLYFNEYDQRKCQILRNLISQKGDLPYAVEIDNLDFKYAFDKKLSFMNNNGNANLLFLDQYGIKHINEDVFSKIINLSTTDFLFFISSSTIKRFAEHPSIAQYISLSSEEIQKTEYHKIHRKVLEYYKTLIPPVKKYYLAPFSLKKNAGIYGIIFGSGHVLGIEKFLRTCWKIDKVRGEANFDIDDDRINQQLELFTIGVRKPKKLQTFQNELREKILNKTLQNDKQIYLFTITNGFLPEHAKDIIKALVKERKIDESKFNFSSKICNFNALLTPVKLN